MNLNVVSPEVPIFTNTKNEALSLNKIIEDKSKRYQRLFRIKRNKTGGKKLTILDPKGIILNFEKGAESASIRFWDKNEFEKLSDENYDKDTLWKRYVMSIDCPYQINFHIGNLIYVDWN